MKINLRKSSSKPVITYYDVLGCSPALSTEDIHDAYLELAFVNHPDRGGDAEVFKLIALAWGQLRNREGRNRYDAQLRCENVLDCSACHGQGIHPGFIRGVYQKYARCTKCGGQGHL